MKLHNVGRCGVSMDPCVVEGLGLCLGLVLGLGPGFRVRVSIRVITD